MESKLVEKTIEDIKKCQENVSMLIDRRDLIEDAIFSEKNKIEELVEKAPVIYAVADDEIHETAWGYGRIHRDNSDDDDDDDDCNFGDIAIPVIFKSGTELMFTMSSWGEYLYYQEEDDNDSYLSFLFDKYKHILSISKIVQRKT